MENWDKHSKQAILRGRLDFLNRKGETFDWDNNKLADLQELTEQLKLIHPDIISEISRVKTEDMYDRIIRPTPIEKEEKPSSYAERTAKTCNNACLDTDIQAQ